MSGETGGMESNLRTCLDLDVDVCDFYMVDDKYGQLEGKTVDQDDGEATCQPQMLASPESLKKSLPYAASNGDVKRSSSILTMRPPVDVENEFGNTALHLGAYLKHKEIVAMLVKRGADINKLGSLTERGQTPLHAAAMGGSQDVSCILMTNGAKINSKDARGSTPLHMASKKGHESVVKLLIENAAVLDERNIREQTPLILAARHGHSNVVQALLEAGADPNLFDVMQNSALHVASKSEVVVDLLIAYGATVDAQNNQGETPLIRASRQGDIIKVRCLLGHAANVNMSSFSQSTALHYAGSNLEVARELLKAGADPNSLDIDGLTPIQYVASEGTEDQIEMIKLLHGNGASVNHQTPRGYTPLFQASDILAIEGTEPLQALLDIGADPNIADERGTSPMHVCTLMAPVDAIELLLSAGADINQKDHCGGTPLMHAACHSRPEVCELLLHRGADAFCQDKNGFTALHYAVIDGGTEVVQILIESAPKLQYVKGKNMLTPLHLLAERNDLRDQIAEIFIKANFDLNITDQFGCTPLHHAAWHGRCDLVTKLINARAMIDMEDFNKEAPLMCAVQRRQMDVVKVFESLSTKLCFSKGLANITSLENPFNAIAHLEEDGTTRTLSVDEIKKVLRCVKSSTDKDFGHQSNLYCKRVLSMKNIGHVSFEEGSEAAEIKQTVEEIIRKIAAEVEKVDPRFKATIIPSGSVYECTKVGMPDEFDYMLVLENFSMFCTVDDASAIQGGGFVSLVAQDIDMVPHEFKEFFGGSTLMRRQLFEAFSVLVEKVANSKINQWPGHFFRSFGITSNASVVTEEVTSALEIDWRGREYKHLSVSLDLVPTLHISTWKMNAIELPVQMLIDQSCYAIAKPIKLDIRGEVTNNVTLPLGTHSKFANMWRVSHSVNELKIFQSLSAPIRNAYTVAKALRHHDVCPGMSMSLPWQHGTHLLSASGLIPSYLLKVSLFQFLMDRPIPVGVGDNEILQQCTLGIFNKLIRSLEAKKLTSPLNPVFNLLQDGMSDTKRESLILFCKVIYAIIS